MKAWFFLSVMLVAASFTVRHGDVALFQITESGKVGFIDREGVVVIAPRFASAGDFSEGLAAVREGGQYGFIDDKGDFVIAPRYDFARQFHEGLVVVYKDGQPEVINKEGRRIMDTPYASIDDFRNGLALVRTNTGKFGGVDKTGSLVIDTVFKSIRPFVDGRAVVIGLNHDKSEHPEVGIIDTSGRFIVPYGTYFEISDMSGGFFLAEIPEEPWDSVDGLTRKSGFINRDGVKVFFREHQSNTWIDGDLHSGLARISLYNRKADVDDDDSFSTANTYEGFINLSGEIVVNDTTIKYVKDFHDNLAFVESKSGSFYIVDTRGRRVSAEQYDDLIGDGFNQGLAIVKRGGKYGLIDTLGNFVVSPQFDGIDNVGVVNGYFFFYSVDRNYHRLYGIAKTDGGILLKPTMDQFDRNGFSNGLLRCEIDGLPAYVSNNGVVVWKQKVWKQDGLADLDIDFMNRGYFIAASKPHPNDLGGFGGSSNWPHKISSRDQFPENALAVVVRPDQSGSWFDRFHAIRVDVCNSTKRTVAFSASDSRIDMKVQAMDGRGVWRDIEYLPRSWCGNSYHILTLGPRQYWTFMTPKYKGSFKTKLRVELSYLEPGSARRDKKVIVVYSNVYEGTVNPGQFWRKQDYFPAGIMDPYFD